MKEIPLDDGQMAQVDDEDYARLVKFSWYAYVDPETGQTFAATDTASGRRVFMHDVVMGIDTLEEELWN